MAREIRPLTGIRGVAACWVVLHHVHGAISLDRPLKTLLVHGYLAVDLFFVLSGFVMALSYGRFATEGWTLQTYGVFLVRRFARIYPLYALMTTIMGLAMAARWVLPPPGHNLTASLLANFALVQTWGLGIDTLDGPAWSISTETAAYLLFPLLTMLTLMKRRLGISLLVAVFCLATIFALHFVRVPPGLSREGPLDIFWPGTFWPLLRCISEFTLGLVAYHIGQYAFVRHWAEHPALAYVTASTLFLLLMVPDTDAAAIMVIPLLLLALERGDNLVTRFMGSRIIFFLGEISYALYLLHMAFVRAMQYTLRRLGAHDPNGWLALHFSPVTTAILALTVFVVILVMCSWLAYQTIEKPCRERLRMKHISN